jgi:glycosyltransferase involved in cell wall biosynthesis
MKIAQIAPLVESVPPKLYGGTERIVAYLIEELMRQGHEVTLFASGDSTAPAELVPCCEGALRLDQRVQDALPYHLTMLDKVRRRADEFDILHFHTTLLHFPMFRDMAHKSVTTLHGRLDLPDLAAFHASFPEMPLVSISTDQRRWLPGSLNWIGTVHHGLPSDLLRFTPKPAGKYLAFLGRVSPEKGVDRAIAIASKASLPLKIAAKIDAVDRTYWEQVLQPLIRAHRNVEFIGEISERQKSDFLGNARALLFPIDWPEPFGIVMIEAMACGTPVIACGCGSVPEVIESGISGIIVRDLDEAVSALHIADGLDRAGVRRAFERRFTAERMMQDYVSIYERLVGQRRAPKDRVFAEPVGAATMA